jgi:hypothetical protein
VFFFTGGSIEKAIKGRERKTQGQKVVDVKVALSSRFMSLFFFS